MEDELRFDGRVVVITGAGAGLGKAYALLFASRGASVVVNDLGGSRSGDGNSKKSADAVVDEIIRSGGDAVADYNSVTDGHKIIQTALKKYGKVDVLINNAGILRDKSVGKLTETDWDAVHNVHLKGAFLTSRAVWPVFQKQNYGKIIVTSSNSGLYGNFGQVNYSSAKMGLVGLCNTMAIEGRKYNVSCNVIVPTAGSRLTEDILPPDLFNELKPELIAPVVCWLCHETCNDSGSVIESAGGWATKYALVRGKGVMLRKSLNTSLTPEQVKKEWDSITDLTSTEKLTSIEEATHSLMESLQKMKEGDSSQSSLDDNLQNIEGKQETLTFDYNFKDCIIYALGIGATVTNPSDLKYLYENDEDFSMFPTMAIIPGQMAITNSNVLENVFGNKTLDLSKVLHGEQYLEIHKQFPTNGCLKSEVRKIAVLDKVKHAVIIVQVNTYDERNEMLCSGQLSIIVAGAGGFGGPRHSVDNVNTVEPPEREPDAVVEQTTSHDQAALYRMTGDLNPLHIDANFSQLGGHRVPILHGLCSLGFSVRHVLNTYGNNDPTLFKSVKVRFSTPVFPGDTLRTEMWREGNRIHFRTSTQTGSEALTGAYIDLHEVIPSSFAKYPSLSVLRTYLPSDVVFEGMMSDSAKLREAKKINAIFVIHITDDKAKHVRTWTIDCKNGTVYEGKPKEGVKLDVVLTATDEDMLDMGLGKLTPLAAYMKGKLAVQGNLQLATKLRQFFVMQSKY